MRRAQEVIGEKLRNRVGRRWASASPFALPTEVTTVRTKGYGPTKDLLKGIDTTNGLLVETALHPADAEMQRRVLALSSVGVSVHTPLDGEAAPLNDNVALQQEGIVAISPEQLSSVATVIVDQLKEQLELSGYTAEAAQDGRSGSVVNAVASCLQQEIERLVVSMQAQEVSFGRMLQENSDLICARVASVIRTERPTPPVQNEAEEKKRHSLLMGEVASALTNLEDSLKNTLEGTLAKYKAEEPVAEDLRVHVVTAIEQASRMQQEQIIVSLEDMLANVAKLERSHLNPPNLESIQEVVNEAMKQVVEKTQHEINELLQAVREKSAESAARVPGAGEAVLEGLLASYGERLEEMRETTAGFADLKELLMEVHSHQQTNMTAIHEVQESVKKLKKELKGALYEATGGGGSSEEKKDDSADQFAEYCDKLDALADRVTSVVEQQLKSQYADVKELPKRLLDLENAIREKQRPALQDIPPLQEIDDERMVALAQSISESILASMPRREDPLPEATSFTKEDLADAVAAALTPKLNELAAAVQVNRSPSTVVTQPEDGTMAIGEQQLITLAQTISESVREAVRDTVSSQPPVEMPPFGLGEQAMIERLEGFKESVLAGVQEEMGRTHEVDLTPFQAYLDEVLGGMQEVLGKQQEATQAKIENIVKVLAEQLQQHEQTDGDARPANITVAELGTLNERLSNEMKSILASELASVISKLGAAQEEVRDAARQSSSALEVKLLSIETSLHEAVAAMEERSLLVQTALDGVAENIEGVKGRGDSETQPLASVSDAVAALTRQSAAAASDIKAQLRASDGRAEAMHAKVTAELLQRIGQLEAEVVEGRRRIDDLISSSADHKEVATTVEAMRLKLDGVGSMLHDIVDSHAAVPPQHHHHQQQQQQQQHQQQEEQQKRVNAEMIEQRLDSLFATTQEILTDLQKYRAAQETITHPPPPTPSPPPLDAKLAKEELTAMEGRLSERLQGLQVAVDGLTQLDAGAMPASDEVLQQESVTTEETNKYVKEIDSLIKIVMSSKGLHARQMREKLDSLRSLVAAAKFDEQSEHRTTQLLEALESNRLKLKEDVTCAEAELIKQVNAMVKHTIDHFTKSLAHTVASSTETYTQQLRGDMDAMEEKLEKHQHHVVSQLHDRIKELDKSQEDRSEKLTAELQSGQKEWHNALKRIVEHDMQATLRCTVAEVCTEQLRPVRHQLESQEAQQQESGAALLSSVQQVSRDVGLLGGLSGELRAAVSGGSAEVIGELRRAHDGLAERIERHVLTVAQQQQREAAEVVASVVSSMPTAAPATSATNSTATTTMMRSTPMSLWWLLALSFVVFASIMACAYFLFAAFLVAFVPVAPPDDLLLAADAPTPVGESASAILKRPSSSRVVDQVIF